jgi:hypothetical protein
LSIDKIFIFLAKPQRRKEFVEACLPFNSNGKNWISLRLFRRGGLVRRGGKAGSYGARNSTIIKRYLIIGF